MLRALAGSVVALALAPGATVAAGPLERYVPVVVHDSRERSPLTPVAGTTPTVHGRQAGDWLQYWMRFGTGDSVMVQYRVRDGALLRGVYAQHGGAERCPARAIRMSPREHPLVFVADGSHAAYFVPGVRDRTWPDRNDEADGKGVRVHPGLVPIAADSPARMRRDPTAWARAARSCTRTGCDELGECDGRETRAAATAAGAGALVALLYGWRRSRRVTAANAAARATPRPAGR